jgi:hypothetical protein
MRVAAVKEKKVLAKGQEYIQGSKQLEEAKEKAQGKDIFYICPNRVYPNLCFHL